MAELAEIKKSVSDMGRELLEKKLVARTWGNISARIDEEHFAISPSGLDYLHTEPEDVSVVKLEDMTWEGRRKPSSEKGIHAAAYRIFPEVNFVIHTHQDFASALGLGGFDEEAMNREYKKVLGHVVTASYGLPGTKRLAANVAGAFSSGAKVVLMAHHGAVICGTSKENALLMALALEEACREQIQGFDKNSELTASEQFARLGIALPAQLDDMAQMIGKKIPVCENDESKIQKLFEKWDAVVVKNEGIRIKEIFGDAEETEALRLLSNKAALAYLHTRALRKKARIGAFDCWLMRTVYKLKYSKKKDA